MVLVAKLTSLLIVALIDPSTCLLHALSERKVLVVRQVVLIAAMLGFLILQTIVGPFINPVSNASEWTSRACYFVTAMIGLGAVFGGKLQSVLEGPILYM
jgi:hypothetical protein